MVQITISLIASSLIAVSLLIHAFALVTPWWAKIISEVDDKYGPFVGLWQFCTSDTYGTNYCDMSQAVPDKIPWTRTMEVFVLTAVALALLTGILKTFFLTENTNVLKLGAASGFAAGALMIVGVAICAAWVADKNINGKILQLHASFALCIVAAIGAIVSGVLFILWYRTDTVIGNIQ